MQKFLIAVSCATGLAFAASAFGSTAAEARIVCKDGFQTVNGQQISTPYCNDAHLAQIAREHGAKVTANEVRNNPAKKYELCRWLSGDPFARDYCPEEGGSDGRK